MFLTLFNVSIRSYLPLTQQTLCLCSWNNLAESRRRRETGYLFGDDVLIDFALHFLKPSRDGGELGSPHRLVQDLLAVSTRGRKCDRINVIDCTVREGRLKNA